MPYDILLPLNGIGKKMDKLEFFKRFRQYANISTREESEALCKVVFSLLSSRLTENESRDLRAQLPSELKEMWKVEEGKGVTKFHKREFLEMIMHDGNLNELEMAEKAARGVFKVLKEQITKGEAEDVAAQLPKDLKEMWISS